MNEKGLLFEQLVLNELLSVFPLNQINYWRDKNKNEVDFILNIRGADPIAIECKWQEKEIDINPIKKFRQNHSKGKNLVICFSGIDKIIQKKMADVVITVVPVLLLRKYLLGGRI